MHAGDDFLPARAANAGRMTARAVRRHSLVVAAALALASATVAQAADVISAVPPAAQPVAGQSVEIRFDAAVDAAFPGGTLEVKTKQSGPCASSPAADRGTGAIFVNGNTLQRSRSFLGLLTFRRGANLICAWLVDAKRNVRGRNAWTVVARPAAGSPGSEGDLLSGWDPATSACKALRRAEVARALGVLTSEVRLPRGGGFTGLTAFEQAHTASCEWQQDETQNVTLVLTPEQTPVTLDYAYRLSMQTGAPEKSRGPCRPVTGVGSAACVFRGDTGDGTLVAVQGHVVVELFVKAPAESAATIRAVEQTLARTVLARVTIADR